MSAPPSHLGVALSLALLGCLPACTDPCDGPGERVIDLDDAVIPATMDLRELVRIDAGYLAVGTGGVIVRRSSFSDWATVESSTSADLLAVGHFGPRIIAVGRAGTITQSEDDGLSFALVDLDLGITEDLYAITLDQQRGVIVGDDRIAWSSDGGDSWALASLPAGSFALRGVADDGDALWAVGLAGVMLRSDDGGASWVEAASPVASDLWAIGYAGIDLEAGLFAVGDAGTILRRTPTSDWLAVEHPIAGELRGVGGNFIVGRDGLVIAIELDDGPEPQRYLELDRDPTRGDLWDVVDDLAVGDGSRLTTIQIDSVCRP